jgi:hypothetical protein
MTTTTTEPRIRFNKQGRKFTVDHLIATDHEGRNGAERRHYATMTVGYSIGGQNYFSGGRTPRSYYSSLSRETEETGDVFTSRSFMLFDGLGLHRSEPVARYSEKALRAFFDEAMAHLAEVRDDPRVAAYFDPEAKKA